LSQGNAIRVLNVQGTQIGHIPRGVAAKLAKYMDNRSLLIEAQITGEKGMFECPIQLKFYGTNQPVEREILVNRMRADKIPVGDAADRKRKETAAAKERERVAKEAAKRFRKNGGSIVGVAGRSYENGVADFMAAPSQAGFGAGPTLEDIVGGSERYNPRNVEQVVEDFGVKEQDLVSTRSLMSGEHLLTHAGIYAQGEPTERPSYRIAPLPTTRPAVDA
jgi:SWI/SNF-related matrix-associated actin-dependent regulator of chromatin subfamily A3